MPSFPRGFVQLRVDDGVLTTGGAFGQVIGNPFEGFRVTNLFVGGEVAKEFLAGATYAIRIGTVMNERPPQADAECLLLLLGQKPAFSVVNRNEHGVILHQNGIFFY